ncbi:hypothetical protein FKM82_001598 [Ascaphus truei]
MPFSGDAGPSSYEFCSSWPFFKMMLFLQDQMMPARTVSNLEPSVSNVEAAAETAGDVTVDEDSFCEASISQDPLPQKSRPASKLKKELDRGTKT